MESRIGRLDLRTTAEASVLHTAGGLVQPFARRVLARCDELLEQRAPGRCVLIRQLDMRWRLLARRLDDDVEVEAVAEALADGLEQELDATSPSDDDNVAAFASEAEYRAEYLAAVAAARDGAWFFHPLRKEGPPPGALGRSAPPGLTSAVLERLAERGALVAVLTALPPEPLEGLARAIGAASLDPAASSATPSAIIAARSPADALLSEQHVVERALSLPPDPPAARRILCLVESRLARGSHAPEAEVRATAERLLRSVIQPPNPQVAHRFGKPLPSAGAHQTQFGGLFFLLGPAVELSLGEMVWKACLPECAFLARVARAILGPETGADPAPRLFGGESPDAALGTIDAERLREMSLEMARALGEALPRRNLARWPALDWLVAHTHAGRLLAAAPAGTPFPVFCWPAPSGSAIERGLRDFQSVWPAGAPPQLAHPALAEADRTGRLRAEYRASLSRPLLLADGDDEASIAALSQAAGSVVCLFTARARAEDLRSPAAFVEQYLSVPAQTIRHRDELVIRLPADSINLTLRRAGLDRDPGWIAWLRTRVRFEYDNLIEAGGAHG